MQNQEVLLAKYFAGEANHQEQAQVRQWMKQHPQEAAKLKAAWEQQPGMVVNTNLAWQQVQRRINQTTQLRTLRRRLLPWAVAAMLVLGLGVVWWNLAPVKQEWQISQTQAKQLDSLTLADGSKVWLHHSSQLRYPQAFGSTQRVVYLKGEAYFEIAKNAHKPFVIYAGNTATKVLGTSFNLKARPEESKVEVSVNSGKVAFFEVAQPNKQLLLTKGKQGRFEMGKLSKMRSYDANLLSWKTGVLSFENAQLSTVVRALAMHYDKPVRLGNAKLANCRLTTRLERLSLSDALEVIALTLNLHYQINENEVLFNGKACF